MEEAIKKELTVSQEHKQQILNLPVKLNRIQEESSFFEGFFLRGIRIDHIQPGFVSCTFKVPARLTDSNGNLSIGAISNIVDEVGFAAIHSDGYPWKVSTDISIACMTTAKLHLCENERSYYKEIYEPYLWKMDEIEIRSKVLGHKGGYSGTQVMLTNKRTGEVVAEGRHSLFGSLQSKL